MVMMENQQLFYFFKKGGYNISDHTKYPKFACSYSVSLHKDFSFFFFVVEARGLMDTMEKT